MEPRNFDSHLSFILFSKYLVKDGVWSALLETLDIFSKTILTFSQ